MWALKGRAEPVAQPATLRRAAGEGGLGTQKWHYRIDKRSSVRQEDGRKEPHAQAHHVVVRGAHDGVDDVVLWGGVRRDYQREPWRQPAGGRGKGHTVQESRRQVPARTKQGFVPRWPKEV